ncbi:MAG: hypothetical protein IPJ20_04785 [Flammeovirgaceae bacterium]|nr:hypothetical protein [Flammeovirgaceae bacterium]
MNEFNNRIYRHDPAFRAIFRKSPSVILMGATTRDANSRMDKLFSYYLPSLDDYQFYINSLIQNDRIGNLSGILDGMKAFRKRRWKLFATILCVANRPE